ncbi:hypothetical protein GCM10022243_19250 [Saccharothrix violaceirubra]|uniref:Amino acid adenylation domain-containing protein n=1 Tax=Saccharothrix violaceirubra TaxID=413306 RepID=A0A7W7T239_9PSEU|nr:amino acid adenylation domain-containing protein [Saccharothrix violaceirubra]MBB4965168.1 amino acid adenylation domain-containing protein [Saccharothrix violaceirubra]
METSVDETPTPGSAGPGPGTLPELLREHARRQPDEPAVIAGADTLTRRELDTRAAAVAAHLRALGVGPDDVVGLYVEPSPDMVVGTWGILTAGAAYLPLAPEYPEDRVRYMVEDSGVDVVLTQPHLRGRLAGLAVPGLRVVTLDEVDPDARATPDDFAGGNLAYVIYTSGTTGRPKGVAIEHRAIVSQLEWLRAEIGIDDTKTVLRKTPMSFDAAQWELLALACGSRIVVGAKDVYRDPSGLIETIITHDVTTLQCVPTLLQALVDDDLFTQCTSLTQVFSGGEALSKKLASRFLEVLPDCELVNLYGPTECTINASTQRVDAEYVRTCANVIAIGTPVAGTTFHILDERQRPAPSGELYIGGRQLARGYLHRPEQTAERFPTLPLGPGGTPLRVYRTGDLARWNDDGTAQFTGRIDGQVKLRGHRVELDEVRLAIENHDWVRSAGVLVRTDPRTGHRNLVAAVELNPREAALMDQGSHGSHHQSKAGRVQVRAQLANLGVRTDLELAGLPAVDLPGREETPEQRRFAFARKTYRFYDGDPVDVAAVRRLFERPEREVESRPLDGLGLADLGVLLRNLGPFHSPDRLLPKYSYASPGALYAVQTFIEARGVAGLPAGHYYLHPVRHRLVRVTDLDPGAEPVLRLHLVGKRSAIESVYRTNVVEVLEFEAGHLLGMLDEVLPAHGLGVGAGTREPDVMAVLGCAPDHEYLATYDVVPFDRRHPAGPVDRYVQAHPGKVAGLAAGQYRVSDGDFDRVADDLVLRKHVVAINQAVYDRASVGVTLTARAHPAWSRYLDLGRELQRLQQNDAGFGLMSSGYSSESGHDLVSHKRLRAILPGVGPTYFAVGGPVSRAQVESEGMREDAVHTKGPAELIKQDIATFLPDYMVPGRVVVVDRLPLSANGKVDVKALAESDVLEQEAAERVFEAPRTETERLVARAWAKVMKTEDVSVHDEFFERGGNSLLAVMLVQEVNRTLNVALPLQVIFDESTVAGLARHVDLRDTRPASRLVPLRVEEVHRPVFCWPGLGGYPMNLRLLATSIGTGRPFYGIQAEGINEGETPYPTIADMAAADAERITRLQPVGPYTLWGYSFGARVAYETAHLLEKAGERVDHLFLIAPGQPRVREKPTTGRADFADRAFVTILFSVFANAVSGPLLDECLATTRDEDTFAAFVHRLHPGLPGGLVRRIIRIVRLTYSFEYTFRELREKSVTAPITIFKARGDDYSFLEGAVDSLAVPPTVVELESDHYGLLKAGGVEELVAAVTRRTGTAPRHRMSPAH